MHVASDPPDLLIIEKSFVRASSLKRFLNYLIDIIGFTVLFVVIGVLISVFSSVGDEFVESDTFGIKTTIIYAAFMSIVEFIFKGKSLGKFFTKTRAVNLDGTSISVQIAFGRGFARVVPFCVFSALGTPCNPWQDKWTKTMVIDEKQLEVI